MSSKLDINEVISILQKRKLPPPDMRAIIEELNARAQAKETDKEPGEPKPKIQHVIIATADRSFGWMVGIPEDSAPQAALERVYAAAHAFNASKAGRKLPVANVGEAFESVKRRFWKDAGVKVINKLMVPVFVTDNTIPEAPSV